MMLWRGELWGTLVVMMFSVCQYIQFSLILFLFIFKDVDDGLLYRMC